MSGSRHPVTGGEDSFVLRGYAQRACQWAGAAPASVEGCRAAPAAHHVCSVGEQKQSDRNSEEQHAFRVHASARPFKTACWPSAPLTKVNVRDADVGYPLAVGYAIGQRRLQWGSLSLFVFPVFLQAAPHFTFTFRIVSECFGNVYVNRLPDNARFIGRTEGRTLRSSPKPWTALRSGWFNSQVSPCAASAPDWFSIDASISFFRLRLSTFRHTAPVFGSWVAD